MEEGQNHNSSVQPKIGKQIGLKQIQHKNRAILFLLLSLQTAWNVTLAASSTWHHHELTVFHMFYHTSNLVPSQQKNPQDPQQDKAANASQLLTFKLPTSLPSFPKKKTFIF